MQHQQKPTRADKIAAVSSSSIVLRRPRLASQLSKAHPSIVFAWTAWRPSPKILGETEGRGLSLWRPSPTAFSNHGSEEAAASCVCTEAFAHCAVAEEAAASCACTEAFAH